MPSSSTCPDLRRLELALAGKLPAAEAQAVETHVMECSTCVRTLATLRTHDSNLTPFDFDSAISELRADDPNVDGLIGRLRGPERAGVAADSPTQAAALPELYDFLAPAQAAGELGRLGRYRVLGVLGAGGMGVVFQAEDTFLRRRVALKAMQPALAASTGYRQRFAREARSAAALSDDHVVTIFDVGEDRGIPFLAMELLEGESLAARLQRRQRLSAVETAHIGRQAALGLAAAHARGLVHRDIKPDNLWIEARAGRGSRGGPAERVKILDFGIARGAAEGSAAEGSITQPARIVGTAGYLSPEQARGEPADARSDLFALGCVLYRACTSEAAFPGATETARIVAVERHEPAAPVAIAADVPPALSDLVMRLLAKRPDRRPASAAAVADELDSIEAACRESPTVDSLPIPAAVVASADTVDREPAVSAVATPSTSGVPQRARNVNATASSAWSLSLFGMRLNLGFSLSIGVTVAALLLVAGLAFWPDRQVAHQQVASVPPVQTDVPAAKMGIPSANPPRSAETTATVPDDPRRRSYPDSEWSPRPSGADLESVLGLRPEQRNYSKPPDIPDSAFPQSSPMPPIPDDESIDSPSVATATTGLVPKDAAFAEAWNADQGQSMPPATTPARDREGLPGAQRNRVSESSQWRSILADLQAMDVADRSWQRYFSLAHLYNNPTVTDDELRLHRAALSLAVNYLNRKSPRILLPVEVDATQTLFRIDARKYGWDDARSWLDLLSKNPYAIAWRDAEIAALEEDVAQSMSASRAAPVGIVYVRGDWFIAESMRPENYRSLMRLPDSLGALELELGVDFAAAFASDSLKRIAIRTSSVAISEQVMDRLDSKDGYYYRLYGFANTEDARNVARLPLGPRFEGNSFSLNHNLAFEADGTSGLFSLPNGLQGYFVGDSAGRALNESPVSIIRDKAELGGTMVVQLGTSCIACHWHGLRNVNPKSIRRIETMTSAIAERKANRLFVSASEMTRAMENDRARFESAWQLAVKPYRLPADPGEHDLLAVHEPVSAVARVYRQEIDLEQAAAELGIEDPQDFAAAIRTNRQLQDLGLLPLASGDTISREMWTSAETGCSVFQQAAIQLGLGIPSRATK